MATLKLDHADTILIFTAVGEHYYSLRRWTDTDNFFKLPVEMQELTLMQLDMQLDLYKRLAEYMSSQGESIASRIFEADTEVKPKKEIK